MLTTIEVGPDDQYRIQGDLFSLAVLDWQLLRRNEIDMPAMRALGWIASLLGVTTIAAIAEAVRGLADGVRWARRIRRVRRMSGHARERATGHCRPPAHR